MTTHTEAIARFKEEGAGEWLEVSIGAELQPLSLPRLYEPTIQNAMRAYLQDGRDMLLSVDNLSGARVTLRASIIMAWHVSTPESRAVAGAFSKARRDEWRANTGFTDDC